MYRFNFYKKAIIQGWMIALLLTIIAGLVIYWFMPRDMFSKVKRIVQGFKGMQSLYKSKIAEAPERHVDVKTDEKVSLSYNLKAVLISGEEKYAFVKRGDESYFFKEGMIIGSLKVEYITVDSVIIEDRGKKVVIKW